MVHLLIIVTASLLASDGESTNAPSDVQRAAPKGPLDFRCDSMRLTSKPNRTFCKGNIVARRDTLFVCCERFEGTADKDWKWQSFLCLDKVRAVRGTELMWSERARFDLKTGELVLEGDPVLKRGPNRLRGERIVIDTETERARVEKPQGRMEPDATELPPSFTLPVGELPARCPLPRRRAD